MYFYKKYKIEYRMYILYVFTPFASAIFRRHIISQISHRWILFNFQIFPVYSRAPKLKIRIRIIYCQAGVEINTGHWPNAGKSMKWGVDLNKSPTPVAGGNLS